MEGHDIKRGQVLFVAETRKGTDYCEAEVLSISKAPALSMVKATFVSIL